MINSLLKLRDWQSSAFDSWKNNNFEGIVSVVTGGGKTIFGIYCFDYLYKNKQIESVIIVVPTKTLQDQWASNFKTFLNISDLEINYNYRKSKKINIIVNASAKRINFSFNVTKTFMILDECHKYGIMTHEHLLSQNYYAKLGLTATLERKYDDGVNQFLIPNIGKIIYSYGYKEALADNVISRYELVNIQTFFNEEEKNNYDETNEIIKKRAGIIISEKNKEVIDNFYLNILEEGLKLLLFKRSRIVNNTEQRIFIAVKIILDNLKYKKIIFCESIKQAETIYEICKESGLSTSIYHSKLSRNSRISNLFRFQNNFSNTLIGCKSLDEGFDVPDINLGIIVSQTKSSRQRIQRLGRTIRKSDGKSKAKIYTLYTTNEERDILHEEMINNPEIKINWIKPKK
jgi:superfamily II DNA or RNA helicase